MPAEREKRIPHTVHDDAIWYFYLIIFRRQTIRYELHTAKAWKGNWGFMQDAYADVFSQFYS
jgi:hypothetical protein